MVAVTAVMMMEMRINRMPTVKQTPARYLIQLLYRYDLPLQCGHLATAAFEGQRMDRWHLPQMTLRLSVLTGRTLMVPTPIVRLQLSRGQMTRLAVSEQVRRQLHGHRTYFLPGGGGAMGVASLQLEHLTTLLCVPGAT
jgi:hypothetical protein